MVGATTCVLLIVMAAIGVVRADLYTLQVDWPHWPDFAVGGVSLITAVGVDSHPMSGSGSSEIHVAQRNITSELDPVFVFDASTGKYLRSWGGGGVITEVHGIRYVALARLLLSG